MSIPYLLRPTRESLDSAVDTWAKLCGAEVVSDVSDQSGKSVVLLEVSKEEGTSMRPSPKTGTCTDSTCRPFQHQATFYPSPPFVDRYPPCPGETSRTSIPHSTFCLFLLFRLIAILHIGRLRLELEFDHSNWGSSTPASPNPHDAHYHRFPHYFLDLHADYRVWNLVSGWYSGPT
jgi:hypothetical protein